MKNECPMDKLNIKEKKMKRTFLIVTLLLLVSSIVPDTAAQMRKFNRGDCSVRMGEKLSLTQEQQTKIDDLRIKHQKEMIDLRSDLNKARLDMKALKYKSDIKRNNLLAATEKMNNIKNKIALARTNHHMDVYELLDEKQKEMWIEFYPKHSGKNKGFHSRHMMRNKKFR